MAGGDRGCSHRRGSGWANRQRCVGPVRRVRRRPRRGGPVHSESARFRSTRLHLPAPSAAACAYLWSGSAGGRWTSTGWPRPWRPDLDLAGTVQSLIPERLWQLGTATLAGPSRDVFLGRGLEAGPMPRRSCPTPLFRRRAFLWSSFLEQFRPMKSGKAIGPRW